MRRCVNTVDLFCGAGGASTGMELALERLGMRHRGLAINHWSVAVDTMQKNHPAIKTKRMSLEAAVPEELVPSGEVDLLWASPSCTHHSRAKGGRPRSNQLRAQPDLILRWLDDLYVRRLIVENVPEFVDWGPLGRDGRPIKSKKGSCFRAWVAALEARNYIVDWRVVNCADYGDATTRSRFFLKAVRRGCGSIVWPEPKFAKRPKDGQLPWRGIRECIDFSDLGTSIFARSKPLADNTLRRIAAGLKKYCGLDFQMDMLGSNGPDGRRLRSLDEPLRTQHTSNRTAVVRPFVVKLRNSETAQGVDDPLSTISAGGQHHMLCQPLVLDHQRNGKARPLSVPIGAQPTHDRFSVVTPMVLGQHGAAQCHPVDEPCPTVATKGAIRLVSPVVVDTSYPDARNDRSRIMSVNDPLNTIVTKNTKVIAFPTLADGRIVDIRIRMLKPEELAAAHSFPADYVLTGTRCDQVKQIGNSVPVLTAAAMCECDLRRVA